MITVTVPLGERSYDVVVGHGARHDLRRLLPSGARRVALVSQAGIPFEVDPGLPFERVDIGDGEEHKSLTTIDELCHRFAAIGLTRADAVVSVGGGMVSDVAGFAASVWHRGVAVVHVPTTLLGMVDAAIGGKTGVNLTKRDGGVGGKNLVGAFWQPSGVVCDLDALATLPPREVRCGRGEMAKYHFLTGDDLLAMDEAERIARCIEIKAQIVASDEREGGRRALLNYGHTLAHALETATEHEIAHGEAVAVGLLYAAHLARRLGRIDDERVLEHYRVVVDAYALDGSLPTACDPDVLVRLMGLDKKVLTVGLTFVLDGAAGLEVVAGVDSLVARAALDDLAAGRPSRTSDRGVTGG